MVEGTRFPCQGWFGRTFYIVKEGRESSRRELQLKESPHLFLSSAIYDAASYCYDLY